MTKLTRILATSLAAITFAATVASAQTTIELRPTDDATIGSGTQASVVDNGPSLTARLSTDVNATRRMLFKFDTETSIPKGSTVQSAVLTLFVRGGEGTTRRIGAYQVTTSFYESSANWTIRKTGYKWTQAGGDLGLKHAEATAAGTVGSAVTFDLTKLVQARVKLTSGSRYTRLALLDVDVASATAYRQFHSSEAVDPALRPKLVVTYGTAAAPAPVPPAPTTTTVDALKVLHWNIHYGIGTDGRYDIDRLATWMAKINPDVISLNEVEKYVAGHGNEDQPARFAALLKAKTGNTWYYHFAQRFGNWTRNGGGNLLLSRFPIAATSQLEMACDRSAGLITIHVNGRMLNIMGTHIDSKSSTCRATELTQLLPWAATFAEQRIIAGDFNASIGNLPYIGTDYSDSWAVAKSLGTAVDFPGNSRDGATHNYRIDFVFTSKGASALSVTSARVFDTRDANGVKPSDHKPLLVTFAVK